MNSSREEPRPRLAFRVGVTGHRALPDVVEDRLAARVRSLLTLVERGAAQAAEGRGSAAPPRLVALSSLAEGADRVVARAALALGWELHCPLPFAREEYAKDFEGEGAQADFDELLANPRTTSVVELDGDRGRGAAAYLAAGRRILEQCDLLLAVWNGASPGGRGGTAEVVAEARAAETPTIWLHAAPPHPARWLLRGSPGTAFDPEQSDPGLVGAVAEVLSGRARLSRLPRPHDPRA